MDFVALDVETANPSLASICQIGIAEFQDGRLTNEREWLIDPEDYFHGMNIRVHGIHASDVCGQPTWPDVYPEIRDLLNGRTVVTHTPFDRNSTSRACSKYQKEFFDCAWFDSARMVRRVWPDCARVGYGLGSITAKLGIKFTHHKAREDARAAGEVVIQAIEQSGIPWLEWLKNYPTIGPRTRESIIREGNVEGILFGESIAFTGALTITRSAAADLAAKAGCAVAPGVTKDTTILVVGDQDITKLAGQSKSSKHRKAEELILKGQQIRIIGESDFRELLSSAT